MDQLFISCEIIKCLLILSRKKSITENFTNFWLLTFWCKDFELFLRNSLFSNLLSISRVILIISREPRFKIWICLCSRGQVLRKISSTSRTVFSKSCTSTTSVKTDRISTYCRKNLEIFFKWVFQFPFSALDAENSILPIQARDCTTNIVPNE